VLGSERIAGAMWLECALREAFSVAMVVCPLVMCAVMVRAIAVLLLISVDLVTRVFRPIPVMGVGSVSWSVAIIQMVLLIVQVQDEFVAEITGVVLVELLV
jgi:hypothetical protein